MVERRSLTVELSLALHHMNSYPSVHAAVYRVLQRELIGKKREQKRNAPTLMLPNEDRPGTANSRLSPRNESKPLMPAGRNVTKVVSPYCQ